MSLHAYDIKHFVKNKKLGRVLGIRTDGLWGVDVVLTLFF